MGEVLCGRRCEGIVVGLEVLAMCAEFERYDEGGKEVVRSFANGLPLLVVFIMRLVVCCFVRVAKSPGKLPELSVGAMLASVR